MWEEEYLCESSWQAQSASACQSAPASAASPPKYRTYRPPTQTFATSSLPLSLLNHTILSGRLQLLSILGTGAYGVVYLAIDLYSAEPAYLAVKVLLKAGLDARQRLFQRRELALHQLASRHPGVVTVHKVFEEGDLTFVVMDYCDDGDLFGMITDRQRYLGNNALIKSVFLQILDAVAHLHDLGIAHRDLKPENILCTRRGERVRIADFGLATAERLSGDFGCGSTFYISPECQGGLFPSPSSRSDPYSTRANDVWSLGVILVNLVCGRNPWRQACLSDETFRAYVRDPAFLSQILPISPATHEILNAVFALDPERRVGLQELRGMVLAVESFTMSEDELRGAHEAARTVAAAAATATAIFVDVDVETPLEPPQHYRRDSDSSSDDDALPTTPVAVPILLPPQTEADPDWLFGKAQVRRAAVHEPSV